MIRSFSPVSTIGGGRVLDPLPPRRAVLAAGLASAAAAERFGALLERRPSGIPLAELACAAGHAPGTGTRGGA